MANPFSHTRFYAQLAALVLANGLHTATKFVTPTHTIRATRKLLKGRVDTRSKRAEIIFSDGRPNYEEREFIKVAVKAGEPFPVKRIIVKMPPEKRKPAKKK